MLQVEWTERAAGSGYCDTASSKVISGFIEQSPVVHGVWRLQAEEALSWNASISTCLQHCSSTLHCNYISVSTKWRVCYWHIECSEPVIQGPLAADFRFGPTRKYNRDLAHSLPLSPSHRALRLLSEEARSRFRPAPCPKGAMLPPEVELTSWNRNEGVGFNFNAALRALNQAACCAGRATLPRINHLDHAPSDDGRATMSSVLGTRPRMCFSFDHLPSVATSATACSGVRGDARTFNRIIHSCPSDHYYMHTAMRAALAYVNLTSMATGSGLSDPANTIVAHVRSGDAYLVDMQDTSRYPSLAYYMSAWKASGKRKLHVVAEDTQGLLMQTLVMIARYIAPTLITIQVGGRSGLASDLATLISARFLIIGSSSQLHGLALSNPDLMEVYAHEPLMNTWIGSCQTRVLVPTAPIGTKSGSSRRWEEAIIAQRLRTLMAAGYNHSISFETQNSPKLACVNLP